MRRICPVRVHHDQWLFQGAGHCPARNAVDAALDGVKTANVGFQANGQGAALGLCQSGPHAGGDKRCRQK